MHLLLTDKLTCPRCGPSFGLILRADRMHERRVEEGMLGCPNCRDSFPIRDGFADLRPPPRLERPPGLVGAPGPTGRADEEEAERLTALLGIVRGPGTIALVGAGARHAGAIAESVEDLLVAAIDPDLAEWGEMPGVSRAMSGLALPFFSRTLRGVVVDARLGRDCVRDAMRTVAPKCRAVVLGAPDWTYELLEEAGLSVLASEDGTVVAARG